MARLFLFFCLLSQVLAFAPHGQLASQPKTPSMTTVFESCVDNEEVGLVEVLSEKRGFARWSLAGIVTGLSSFVTRSMAATDDGYEIAELPPPYIPALFGVVLLVGVGVLTSSLGNVMDEEASLGLQSGARAKKEIERSRSSYFKKN